MSLRSSRAWRTATLVASSLVFLLGAPVPSRAGHWLEFGPSPIAPGSPSIWQQVPTTAGRINALAISPTNPDVVFIGASLGGVWRTRDGGAHWVPLFDDAPGAMAVEDLALSGTTLWVGTGGEFAGDGLYRIPNAETVGEDDVVIEGPFDTRVANPQVGDTGGNGRAFSGNAITTIIVDPNHPNRMWVGTNDAHFHAQTFGFGDPRAEPGLYYTAGADQPNPTFWKIPTVGPSVDDAVLVSAEGGGLIVATIDPAVGSFGGGAVYRLGLLERLPLGLLPTISLKFSFVAPVSQAQIDLAASGLTVYAATSQDVGTLYKSTNGGVSFLRGVTTTPGPGEFQTNAKGWGVGGHTGGVGVDPTDPDNVMVGGAESYFGRSASPFRVLMASHDGGQTFRTADGPYSQPGGTWLAYVHPDTTDIMYAPSNPDIAYTVNDGGIYRTNNARDASPGGSPDLSPIAWTSLNTPGLGITQFYDMDVHPSDPDYTLAGSQDNGAVLYNPFGGDNDWKSVDGGDAFSVAIDRNASNTVGVTLYSDCRRYDSTAAAVNYAPFFALAAPCEFARHGFRAGPGNPSPLYRSTYWEVQRSGDKGVSWASVSPPILGPWSVYAIDPSNDQRRIFVGSNQSVYFTSDGSSSFATPSTGNWPTDHPSFKIGVALIAPDSGGQPDTAYLGFEGYASAYVGTASRSHVWKTTNLSATTPTWTAIGDGLPDVPVRALVLNPANGDLFAGTDSGVFRLPAGATTWTPLAEGLLKGCTPLPGKVSCAPTLQVFGPDSMGIVGTGTDAVLRVATYGRGIWEYWLGGEDSNPPLIDPQVSGPLGNSGWFVGDVSVGWGFGDAESPRTFMSFCESGMVTLDTSPAGKTFTCRVSSFGGKTVQSVSIKRDATPPVLTCQGWGSFEQNTVGFVSADVVDGASGSPNPTVSVQVDTAVIGEGLAHLTGEDGAGNVGSVDCPYSVVPEPGLLPGLALGLASLGVHARRRRRDGGGR